MQLRVHFQLQAMVVWVIGCDVSPAGVVVRRARYDEGVLIDVKLARPVIRPSNWLVV